MHANPSTTTQRLRLPQPLTEELRARLAAASRQTLDLQMDGETGVDVFVDAEDARRIQQAFPEAQWLGEGRPFSEFENAEGYFTPEQVSAELDALQSRYPGTATKINLTEWLGTEPTEEGRPLLAIKLARPGPASGEPRRAAILAMNHHARELNTTYTGVQILRRFLASADTDPALKALLETTDVYVIPNMNPDGLARVWNGDNFWRKNRHHNRDGSFGVDQNRNYPALYGREGASTRPPSEVFRGEGPSSERETKTLIALADKVGPELYLDLHSSGQEVLDLYPKSAKVSPAIALLGTHYARELEKQANYGERPPSGSGEAPHELWMHHGALAYLIELGKEFQPPISEAEEEVPRVWAAVRHALTSWRPAARGVVTNARTGEAVRANISFEKGLFLEGEQRKSRAGDGAFSLWLPKGEHQVTFSAEGFAPKTLTLNVVALDDVQSLNVTLEPVRQVLKRKNRAPARLAPSPSVPRRSPM